jgi:hypothetical protein
MSNKTRPYRVLLRMPDGSYPWVIANAKSKEIAIALAERGSVVGQAVHVVGPDLDCQGVAG